MDFEISKEDIAKVDTWWKKHADTCWAAKPGAYATAPGGILTYMFTHTSIGTITRVRCGACKEEYDFTDYDCW